jgi:hypothetical protein
MDDRRSLARSAVLLVVTFVGTLALLGGLVLGLAQRGPSAAGGSPAPASATAVASVPSATPTAAPGSASPPIASGPIVSPPGASSPVGDPVLVGAGDIGDCETDDDSATADLIARIPGTVFTAGDNAYPDGSAAQFRECYDPTWGRFRDRTRPAPGNHDYLTEGASAYLDYFGAAAVNEDGDPWYSYEIGAWHVIVLDSECDDAGGCGPGSPQGRWLAADLAASDAVCTMAIFHKPRFSSGYHGASRSVAPFWDALHAAGADVVVNGHDHDYERFAPQNPAGREDRARGLREFVIGTGGTGLREFGPPVPNSELRASVTHGVLKFTLRSRGYDWAFIPTTGSFSDRGSAHCH